MTQTHLHSTAETREEQLRQDPAFRAYWERAALARAVTLALIGYRVKHHLTQTWLAEKLGVRQPQVARLEMGSTTLPWRCSSGWHGRSACGSSSRWLPPARMHQPAP